jgi:hypothetical protein
LWWAIAKVKIAWAGGRGLVSQEPLPLFIPIRRQRPLKPLQHEPLIRSPCEDPLDDVRRHQCEAQDPADIAFGDALCIADVANRGVDPIIEQLLPPPRSRERLDQRAVRCGFELRTISLPSGATMRFLPPRRWNRIGIRTTSVFSSNLVSARCIMPPFFRHLAAAPRPG